MLNSTAKSVVNLNVLSNQLSDDSEFLRDLLKDFIQDVQSKLTKFKMYLLQNNFEGIRIVAHSLKGTTSYFAADFMNEAARKLETAAERKDARMAFTYFKILEAEFIKFMDQIKTK